MTANLSKTLFAVVVACATIGGALVVPIAAQTVEDSAIVSQNRESSYARGFGTFQRYCRSCHGKAAQGDGHVAKYLKIPPTDLTRLAAENGGDFPTERVLRSIDGREEMVPLHGRDMPIWGSVFQVDDDQTEADVQQRLNDLIAYLKEIQAEDGAPAEELESD